MADKPEPVNIKFKFDLNSDEILFSHMELGELMKLNKYISELVVWKMEEPVTKLYAVIKETKND